jgi:hypothetical protein
MSNIMMTLEKIVSGGGIPKDSSDEIESMEYLDIPELLRRSRFTRVESVDQ